MLHSTSHNPSELTPLNTTVIAREDIKSRKESSSPWKVGLVLLIAVGVIGVAVLANSGTEKGVTKSTRISTGESYPDPSPSNFTDTNATNQTKSFPASSSSSSSSETPESCPEGHYKRGCRCVECRHGFRCPGDKKQYSCKPGTYQPKTGQTKCLKSPCGSYVARWGASSPSQCPAGTYSGESASTCTTTPKGTYTDAGACHPKDCGPGKYQGVAGQSSCKTAECGHYAPGPRSTIAYQCPAGKYSEEYTSSCSSTPPGTYTKAGACKPTDCGPGEYQSASGQSSCKPSRCGYYVYGTKATAQIACPAGKYSAAGASSCTAAPNGTYTGEKACKPVDCGGGFYQPSSGKSSCIPTECGYYAKGPQDMSPRECPEGKYSEAQASSCTDTPKGTYTSARSCSPKDCGPGKYQDLAGQSSCKVPECGYYAPGPRSMSQKGCPAGTYSKKGASGCITTPAGTKTGEKACSPVDCGPGKFQALPGQKCCENASCGHYAPGPRSTSESQCPAGKYSNASASSCETTPAGTYTEAGACAPSDCGPGMYQELEGKSSCVIAKCGYYAAGPRSLAQEQCPPGTYAEAGAPNCTQTPPGTFTTAGACSPVNCGGGKYQELSGQVSCNTAKCGYYARGPRSTSETQCGEGTYSGAGAASCTTTPAGSRSSAGACGPTQCKAGSYASGYGQATCPECPENSYQSRRGQTSCTKCRYGYCADAGSTSCDKKCSPPLPSKSSKSASKAQAW